MHWPRYYVRWEECWGGTRIWTVADRERRETKWRARDVGKKFKTEAAAKRACDRMNADLEKFFAAAGDR